MIKGLFTQAFFVYLSIKKNMTGNYYQVVLKTGKIHSSLYVSIQTAIKKVGAENIKQIKEIRKELVDTKYTEILRVMNID